MAIEGFNKINTANPVQNRPGAAVLGAGTDTSNYQFTGLGRLEQSDDSDVQKALLGASGDTARPIDGTFIVPEPITFAINNNISPGTVFSTRRGNLNPTVNSGSLEADWLSHADEGEIKFQQLRDGRFIDSSGNVFSSIPAGYVSRSNQQIISGSGFDRASLLDDERGTTYFAKIGATNQTYVLGSRPL